MDTHIRTENEEPGYDEEPAGKRVGFELFAGPIGKLHRRAPQAIVGRGSSILEAVRAMRTARTGCVLVEEAGRLVGILTERDILNKLVGTGYDPAQVVVEGVMTLNPETLRLEDPIVFALQRMSVGGFRHIPLVDDEGRAVGVLSVKDIVDHLVEHFPEEILNLPPEPGRHALTAEGG